MIASALAGERVLDFCWVGAGALVTQLLAVCGADVIKVESRARPDNLRVAPPFAPGVSPDSLDRSGYFASRNSNKRSLALDMRHEQAREVARRLAAKSTIVTSNFRPGVMERWGLDATTLRRGNPELIFLSMPMQGAEGPRSDYIGFGSTIAALAGITYPSGVPGRAPVGTGTHYPDHVPNPGHALVAVLAAVHRRRRTGEGASIELAQLESTVNVMGPDVIAVSAGADAPEPHGNRVAHAAPHGVYPCAGTDTWCAIVAVDDRAFAALCDVLAHPEWSTDRRYAALSGRKRHEDDLDDLISSCTRHWDPHDLMRALQARGVPASVVATPADVLDDPNLRARGYWRKLPHAAMGEIAVNGVPFSTPEGVGPTRAAPLLGEHTYEVLSSLLDITREEYDGLASRGVLA